MKLFFVFIAVLLITMPAQARPISYPGGWTAMTMNDSDENSAYILYTPDPHYSFGWQHEYTRGSGSHADFLQLNNLLHRWNNPASQANLYLESGIGVAYDSDDTEPAAYTGLSADWETRRWYLSYGNKFAYAGDIDRAASHEARIGVAPYVANYGSLHTWLMLQADYDAGNNDSLSLTPLVRMFKATTMVEAGVNLDGGVLFHLMHTF
jgi:hypothetical protein